MIKSKNGIWNKAVARELVRNLLEIDPLSRPLFTMMVAEYMGEMALGGAANADLIGHVLAKEAGRRQALIIDKNELRKWENLLLLATMAGGLTPKDGGFYHVARSNIAGLIPDLNLIDDSLYRDFAGSPSEGAGFAGFQPDILGEHSSSVGSPRPASRDKLLGGSSWLPGLSNRGTSALSPSERVSIIRASIVLACFSTCRSIHPNRDFIGPIWSATSWPSRARVRTNWRHRSSGSSSRSPRSTRRSDAYRSQGLVRNTTWAASCYFKRATLRGRLPSTMRQSPAWGAIPGRDHGDS